MFQGILVYLNTEKYVKNNQDRKWFFGEIEQQD